MTSRLRAADIERLRSLPGHAAGLFITDRCPVGCAHCSVDSRPDSPRITDFDLFDSLIRGLAAESMLEVVAITGGEPFVERRGMERATEVLKAVGKKIVVFTSGAWASSKTPAWIGAVLDRVDTVFLSTDQFHLDGVSSGVFVAAARAVAARGCWLVIQTIATEEASNQISDYLCAAFGENFSEHAEIVFTRPLAYGRGDGLFPVAKPQTGREFGACGLLASPLIRYDGRLTACCNERVIMGRGSARLARRCRTASEVGEGMERFRADPLLTVLGSLGMDALTMHPRFAHLQRTEYPSICEACWAANDEAGLLGNDDDPLLAAMATLGKR